MLKRYQKLARNDTFSESKTTWVIHSVTAAQWYVAFRKPDLDGGSSVLHQHFIPDSYIPLIRNTYGGPYGGSINIYHGGAIDVTANGSADPDRVLLRVKGINDEVRSKSFQMELNHTGDGTHVFLHSSRWLKCIGASCGKNGLHSSNTPGPKLIIQELYVNGWSATDKVQKFGEYRITSHIANCKRVGKLTISGRKAASMLKLYTEEVKY